MQDGQQDNNAQAGWTYNGGQPQTQLANDDVAVSWTASEFIAHEKSAGWYGLLVIATIAVLGLVYLVAQDILTIVFVAIAAVLFAVIAAKQPRELQYEISETGIMVGNKFYAFSNFRSFAVVREGGIDAIWFMPLRSFMPSLTIYFAPEQGQKIVDVLAELLPFENREQDMIDKLMHRLRF